MDRITRYARPHCYDASRGPLSFLDNGQRSRSSPRINVDSITRKACPERPPSDSASTSGFAGSRMRAQSTDSLTWRRAVALKTRQQVISPRQHQSHAELRTDSSECLIGTVVVDFTDTQIGETPVFDPPIASTPPKPLDASTPHRPLSNGSAKPPVSEETESRVRPVVETVAVLGRRLSYSKAAGADRLDSSDLDDIARQIGLLSSGEEPQQQQRKSPPRIPMENRSDSEPSPTPEPKEEGRSRKSRMGWLGGLFRRLRHWPESSQSGETKKQRRRARSLPPSSKGRSQPSASSGRQSPNSPSTAADSPPTKKSSFPGPGSAKSSLKKRGNAEMCEKPISGVSRSRTVDNIERARAFPSDEPDLVLPRLDTTRVTDSPGVELQPASNGHVEVDARPGPKTAEKSPQPPSYCNLAILAYGYSAAYPGTDAHEARKEAVKEAIHAAQPEAKNGQRQPTPDERQSTNDERQPQTDERQPTPDERQSTTDERQPPTDERQSTNEERQPTPDERQPPTDERQLPNDEKEVPTQPETIQKPSVPQKEEESQGQAEEKEDKQPAVPEPSLPQETAADEVKKRPQPMVMVEVVDDSVLPPSDGSRPEVREASLPKDKGLPPAIPEEQEMNGVDVKTPRVTISLEPAKEKERRKGAESPNVVVRRKKTVSCSEAPDSVPRSSLIMLAVSQASPRPKTEMVDEAMMRHAPNPMSVSQHEALEGEETKDGFYFLRLAAQVEAEFKEKMRGIERDLETDSERMTDEVSGILRSVLGKANLLLTDKFSQLRGLCQQNISEQVDPVKQRSVAVDGFATRNSDLDGYWALVELQVDDVRQQLGRVAKLRDDAWQLPEAAVKKPTARATPQRRRKKAVPSGEATGARSAASQARLEARKRLEKAKREAASKLKEGQNHVDKDVFIFV